MSSIEGSGLAGEQVGGELVELGLLEPAEDPGQGAVGGDPVVVQGQVAGPRAGVAGWPSRCGGWSSGGRRRRGRGR